MHSIFNLSILKAERKVSFAFWRLDERCGVLHSIVSFFTFFIFLEWAPCWDIGADCLAVTLPQLFARDASALVRVFYGWCICNISLLVNIHYFNFHFRSSMNMVVCLHTHMYNRNPLKLYPSCWKLKADSIHYMYLPWNI